MSVWDVVVPVLLGAALGTLVYRTARWLGLGRCYRCGRLILPWGAYCRRCL